MPKQEIAFKNVVFQKEGQNMLTGIFSERNQHAWKWDRTSIESEIEKSTYHNYNIGGFKYNLDEGTSIFDWNNQVLSNLNLKSIETLKENDFDIWTPVYENGLYSMFGKNINLYSSYSYTGVSEEEEGSFVHTLHEDAQIDTISLAIFTRNSYKCKVPYKTWHFQDDTKKRNYIIANNKIITSDKDRVTVGIEAFGENQIQEIKDSFENKEASASEGRIIFSNYFPIEKESFKIYALKNDSIIRFKEVENLSLENDLDYIYEIDYELGIIKTGGITYPELCLKQELDAETTTINLSSIDNLKTYPESGVLKIEDELIFYNNKSKTNVYNCVRGYLDTKPKAYQAETKVNHIKNGKSIPEDWDLYIGYNTVPRVQYEVSEKNIRRSNKNMFVDLHPFNNLKENGIIQISNVEKHVSKLTLEINAKNLGANLFGPGFFGIDYKQLTATAFDSLGNTVEDVEITIKILNNGNGYFNSNTKIYKDISNQEGQIYAFYNAPYDWNEISKEVYRVYHEGDETIMEVEEFPAGSLGKEQVQLYEVLKHDPVFGYNGLGLEVLDYGNGFNHENGNPGSTNAFVEVNSAVLSSVDSFEGSKCIIQFDDDGILTRYIEKAIDKKSIDGSETSMILILDKQVSFFNTANKQIKKVWLYERKTVEEPEQPNSLEWNTFHKIGALKVVYHWNENSIHPLTRENGAYYPLRPLMPMQPKEIKFSGKLRIPDPFDREEILGGYVIVSSSTVEFQAFCKDPLTNKTIASNIIALRLDLPKYLNGVSFDEALPVPYGFGIVSDELEVGTGLGGANFISVNPLSENINTLRISLKES